MGTTIGNTDITITGTGFVDPQSDIKVTIDGIDCPIKSMTATQIVCTSGPRPVFTESTFVVSQKSSGHAANKNNLVFAYVDRWSDPNTWGGESPPREGDSVYIPPGQNILLDESTPKLYAVILEKSRLIFDHTKDLKFDAELIFVKEGQLIIGSEE
jgi:hypothetical protein